MFSLIRGLRLILGLSFSLSANRGFDGPASFELELRGAVEVSVPCPSSLDLSSGEAAVRVRSGGGIPLFELSNTTLRPSLGVMPPPDDGPIGIVPSSLDDWK
jgi:hypothetical protein